MKSIKTHANLDEETGSLCDLPRRELVERWRALYRGDPPKGISRVMLVRAVSYEIQVKALGGLKPATARRLRNLAQGLPADETGKAAVRPKLGSGSRLVRDWNGMTQVVEVTDDGFLWGGARYRSLSAIARAITGARWSGPRFFAIKAGDRP